MPPRYQEWLAYLFEHPVTEPEWYFEVDAPVFEASETEIVALMEATFRRSAQDLALYSDAQVDQGLWYLLSSTFDHGYALRSDAVPLELRRSAIAAIAILYRDLFVQRCTRTLSHLNEEPSSPLNSICYMLWDVTPLGWLQGYRDESELADACYAVLADTLKIDHPACQEAAIHGYGEFHSQYPERSRKAMERFLQTPPSDPRLRAYAEQAAVGDVL